MVSNERYCERGHLEGSAGAREIFRQREKKMLN